jgi:hypothetical protein
VKTQGAIKNEQSNETGNIQDEDKQNKNTTKGVASLFCSASNQTQKFFFTRCKMVRSEMFSWVN